MIEIPLKQDENSHSPRHFYRCATCYRLISMRGFLEEGICGNHRITYARHFTLIEWIRVKLGLVPFQEGGLKQWMMSLLSPRKNANDTKTR